jgi:hypothetical protein
MWRFPPDFPTVSLGDLVMAAGDPVGLNPGSHQEASEGGLLMASVESREGD